MSEEASGKSDVLPGRNSTVAVANSRTEEIKRHIKELLNEDSLLTTEAISELEKYGEEAARVLVETLFKKSSQPELHDNLTTALEEIGKPSVNALIHALGHITEIKNPEAVYLLESIVETLGKIKDKHAFAPILEQIDKLNKAVKRNHNAALVDISEAAKTRIHLILSENGIRDGLEDLLAMLGDGKSRVREGIIEAVAKIGDNRALTPLLRLYEIETPVSFSGAQQIKTAFKEIVKKYNVDINDRVFKTITVQEKATLEKIYPKLRVAENGNGNGHHKLNGNGKQ